MEFKGKLKKLIERIIAKYGLSLEDAEDTVEFALFEYKRLSNDYETSLENYTDDVLIWIKKASYEIIERNMIGIIGGLKSYSENGYSWSADGGIISEQLQKEIIANVDYPR